MSLEILSLVGKDRLFEISVYGVVRAFKNGGVLLIWVRRMLSIGIAIVEFV